MGKFYITTAIDYVNSTPHLGHAYEKIAADVIARWSRLIGNEVFFLTGTDENAQKNAKAAKKTGKKTRVFVDEMAENFKKLCKVLDISYDDFIRTTENRHKKVAQKIFKKLKEKGDIYKGRYEGLYCSGCEAFYTEKDLVDGKCPEHKKECVKLSEPSYFFKLSKHQKYLEKLLKDKDFVMPEGRRKEVLNRVKEGLKDLSVSRYKMDWGIPVKSDPEHSIYVWFDALLNYISALGYPKGKKYKKFWPADIHLIGIGINWFHSVIWPAMLKSIGIDRPEKIFVHGYINLKGEKMSKSLGIVVDPFELAERFGTDQLRYFLIKSAPFGEDMDFSERAFVDRINGELVSDLGNLVYRVLTLAEKYPGDFRGKKELDKKLDIKKIEKHMKNLELHLALEEIWSFVREANKYINKKEPWNLKGKELGQVLYNLLEALRVTAILLWPFMPGSSEIILKQLGVERGTAKDLKFRKVEKRPEKGRMLFEKVELEKKKKAPEARDIKFSVEPEAAKKWGIKAAAAKISGVRVKKKHSGLKRLKKKVVKRTDLDKAGISDRVLGYKEIYQDIGVDIKHPVENLVYIVQNSGKLPTINTVVDSYNMVALEKQLSIGAHDLDKIEGDVAIKVTDGSENYTPLGSKKKEKVNRGEYGLVDSENRVLCRMDMKQCEQTKINFDTRSVFLYVQGNRNTPQNVLEEALKECCENIVRFCGGKWERISS